MLCSLELVHLSYLFLSLFFFHINEFLPWNALCACTIRMCDFGQPGNPVRSLAAFVVRAGMHVL